MAGTVVVFVPCNYEFIPADARDVWLSHTIVQASFFAAFLDLREQSQICPKLDNFEKDVELAGGAKSLK